MSARRKRVSTTLTPEQIRDEAKRIGIPPEELVRQRIEDVARAKLVDAIGPRLINASDLLGERIAAASAAHDYDEMHELASILGEVWHVRWDLGMLAGGAS